MANESRESQQAHLTPSATGRRAFLRDGLSLVGGTALASVAMEMLHDPATAFGNAPIERPHTQRPTCLAVAIPGPEIDPEEADADPNDPADPEQILTCDDTSTVILWRPKKNDPGKFHKYPFVKLHGDKATYVTASRNNALEPHLRNKVLTTSYDGMVFVRDLTKKKDKNPRVFDRHPGLTPDRKVEVWVAALSTDGTRALSGDNFGNILYWKTTIPNPPIIHHFKHEAEWVSALAFLPEDPGIEQKQFLSGHENGKMLLWNIANPAMPQKVFQHPNDKYPVNTVAVISKGTFFASGSFDGKVRIWDPAIIAGPKHEIPVDDVVVWRIAISEDGERLAAATQDFGNTGLVRLFDISKLPNAPTEVLPGPPVEDGGVMGVGFLDNRRIVYTTGDAAKVQIKVFQLPP
jgi:WD40 repeat protein